VAQAAEHLLGKFEAWNLNPSPIKKIRKKPHNEYSYNKEDNDLKEPSLRTISLIRAV
jgi:hypothetical protein